MINSTYILDIGNSRAKLSRFINSQWEFCFSIQRSEYATLEKTLKSLVNENDALIWTSVVEMGSELLRNEKSLHHFELNRSYIDVKRINYETSETLGLDRFYACLGAWSKNKENPCIVIDAGTALTIDLMDEKGVFQGGIISPGLQLWERSLQLHAPALPSVKREIPSTWPPKSTKNALKWGISGGFIALIETMILNWEKAYPNANVVCTGGDGEWVSSQITKSEYDRFLVEKGCLALWEAAKL